jgi:hypothetical protein
VRASRRWTGASVHLERLEVLSLQLRDRFFAANCV